MKELCIKSKQSEKYPISKTLFGIFLEDINFACDGGLNANQVSNYSFDGVYMDKEARCAKADPLRYWHTDFGQLRSGTENRLSSNSNYGILKSFNKALMYNKGYNGLQTFKNNCAISVKGGKSHVFSAYVRNGGYDGKAYVYLMGDDDAVLTEKTEFDVSSAEWTKVSADVKGINSGYGRLVIELDGVGEVHFDCISFYNEDIWGKDDPKWKHGKFRKDLVEALKELKPKFMRFPGGCIVEGAFYGNEYNWKDTVGELYERKPNYNLWSERTCDGGYSQSYQIGFYEYFCLCEDLGMKPLPTLFAGLNCEIRARGRNEPAPEIKVDDPLFKSYVIDNYLDLIEFANGDPDKNEWAALRKRMGHPEPFGLDRIGIGNEQFADIYFDKFTAIKKAIQEKYPYMKCILAGGYAPEADYLAPFWNFAKTEHPDCIVDEHSYNTPEWFISEESRFDNYERGTAKVYMGEYAANGTPEGRKWNFQNGNYYESALAEAAFLCGIERNGDVVEMSSYAPLFNLIGSDQWRHNLIDFNPAEMCLTSNYLVQRIFSVTSGDEYIPMEAQKPERVFVSLVKKDDKKYLKVVNITDEPVSLTADLESKINMASVETICSPEGLLVKNQLGFTGTPDYKIKDEVNPVTADGSVIKTEIAPMSVNVFTVI